MKNEIHTMSLKDARYYFSHYANMGRHNAYVIISDITEQLELPKKEIKEESLQQCGLLSDSIYRKYPERRALASQLLCQHFPFLSYFREQEVKDGEEGTMKVMATLKSYLTDLNTFRNEYTHAEHEHRHIELQELQGVFGHAIAQAARMQQTLTEKDFESQYKAKYLNPLWGTTEGDENDNGVFFFLCLFLEKKYAFQFLGKLNGFKNTQGGRFRAQLEAFTQLCCRLPYPKLDSADIALDMLNELARCPKELYHVLSAEKQKDFLAKEESTEQGMLEEEQPDENEPIMMRSGTRFPYFALRYFDESGKLEGIQFQLNLGRMHKAEAHEKIINGEKRLHPILKEIHLFGHLSDYQTDEVRKKLNPADNPRVEFYSPKYNITGNRIALSLTPYNRNNVQAAIHKIANGETNLNQKAPFLNQPQAIISTNELAALFFYNHLYRQGKIECSPQELIGNYIESFKSFVADLKDGTIRPVEAKEKFRKKRHHTDEEKQELAEATAALQQRLDSRPYPCRLKVKDLPDVCREYLLSYKSASVQKTAIDKLGKMQKETKYQQTLLEEIQTNGYRSKAIVKNGELAQQIARDIVFLTKPQPRGEKPPKKINGMEYDILQKALAYYPVYKKDLKEYLSMLKEPATGRWTHPFLHKVLFRHLDRCNTLLDFAAAYYEEKKRWLACMLVVDRGGKKRLSPRAKLEEWSYFLKFADKTQEAVKKEWNLECIYLSTGLLDEGIRHALQLKETDNAAYALKRYFDGKTQSFYLQPRYYNEQLQEKGSAKERDVLKEEINSGWKGASEEQQAEWKKTIKRIRANETEILRQQTEDRALFLMAIDRWDKQESDLSQEDIERVGFDVQERNLLDEDREMEMYLHGKRVTARLPIKRYGEFRRFLKDRRLEGLLPYYATDTIPLGTLASAEIARKGQKGAESNLVEEMECYDTQRMDFIEMIMQFETLVGQHCQEDAVLKEGERPNHWAYVEAARRTFPEIEVPSEQLNTLRMKLAHNEIPYEEWIKEAIEKDHSTPMITQRIIGLARRYYDTIIQEIEKS
ncbi:MAG: type VI-B CRISPR-associated RNA-guided ribonuclease Cas13b [Mediterranea sp.]|jgi:predicted DNA binding CopG/RHH family protein|nr:type VI-B CRISPR-associated RNA-guided ribonuclease Cas13b [Mediterranea sp.]